jgi:Protein of unknown function DUF262
MKTVHYQTTIRSFLYEIDNSTIVIDPDWQRGDVWTLDQQQCLIDSMTKGMPFGSLMVWINNGKKVMVDGKQRTTTISKFLSNKFQTTEGETFDRLSPVSQSFLMDSYIHILMIDDASEQDIVDMFDRINSGRQLSDGERIASQKDVSNIVNKVYETIMIPDGILCQGWENTFGKIKAQKRKNEFANTVPLLMSSIYGVSACTTSYPLLKKKGLNEPITTTQYDTFLEQLSSYLETIKYLRIELNDKTLFKGSGGVVPLGKVSPIWCSVILLSTNDPILTRIVNVDDLMDMWTQFYKYLMDEEVRQDIWDTLLRKNRTETTIRRDIKFAISKTSYAS